VQPYLSLRATSHLGRTERALYNYSDRQTNRDMDAFMRSVHERLAARPLAGAPVVSMSPLHRSREWIFLDYCHLTARANELIARELAEFILSGGRSRHFAE
jgi:hypothetical protein